MSTNGSGLQRIGIIGAGNVGSALLMQMAAVPFDGSVEVIARNPETARAAILDVESAFPQSADAFRVAGTLSGDYDVVVITAGVQPAATMSRSEMLRVNLSIAVQSVENVKGSDSVVFVIVGSPVDELTEEFLKQRSDVEARQVIGFGGELDKSRLIRILLNREIVSPTVAVVGEHGPRTIPVYESERAFDSIAYTVRSVLRQVQSGTGKARNLASGVHLMRLLQALGGVESIQCVSALGEEGLSLTWPHKVGYGGALSRVEVSLGTRARQELELLIKERGG